MNFKDGLKLRLFMITTLLAYWQHSDWTLEQSDLLEVSTVVVIPVEFQELPSVPNMPGDDAQTR